MRTQKGKGVTAHLANSRQIFLHIVDKVRSWNRKLEQQYIDARDYEALELAVMKHLMGVK
jgi:xylose isomerase